MGPRQPRPHTDKSKGRGGAPVGNLSAQTHGHKKAEIAINKGLPLSGLALERQHAIQDQIHSDGLPAVMEVRAARLAACADLIFNALCAKWEDMDIKQKVRFMDVYSRMEARAIKGLRDVFILDLDEIKRQAPTIEVKPNDTNT